MPPKKRQRVSPPEETASSAAATPANTSKHASGAPSPDPVNGPWTDEQEAALFKGIIKWKPVGMHKHFRMLSLVNYMHSHGHEAEHTRASGIWAKLNTLYNMKMLDEREDVYGDTLLRESPSSTPSSNASGVQPMPFYAFELPEDAYISAMMFDKRVAEEAPTSPSALPWQLSNSDTDRFVAESYSAADTDDMRSAAMSTPAGNGKSGRGANSKSKAVKETARKASKPREESTSKGNARARSKKDEDIEEEEDEEEGEDQEDDGSDGEEEESERGTPKTRGSTRGRGRGRGQGRGRSGRRR